MNLFIDTNIFLNFYHYSGEDIEKLGLLHDLIAKAGEIDLFIPNTLSDEFYRNRENKIADALKIFDGLDIKLTIPRLCSGYSEVRDLNQAVKNFKESKEKLRTKLAKDVQNKSLKADTLINSIFSTSIIQVEEELVNAGKNRFDLGNPPGKDGSYGDAINWEFLLKYVPQKQSLHLISSDSDYASPLEEDDLALFLKEEWESKKSSKIFFYKSLNAFFKKNFPDIILMDDFIKDSLIAKLYRSGSFDTSRSLLQKLSKLSDFTANQLNDIVLASIVNEQIYKAHEYSPDLIGKHLERLIHGRESYIDNDNYYVFCRRFGINPVRRIDYDDLPF